MPNRSSKRSTNTHTHTRRLNTPSYYPHIKPNPLRLYTNHSYKYQCKHVYALRTCIIFICHSSSLTPGSNVLSKINIEIAQNMSQHSMTVNEYSKSPSTNMQLKFYPESTTKITISPAITNCNSSSPTFWYNRASFPQFFTKVHVMIIQIHFSTSYIDHVYERYH